MDMTRASSIGFKPEFSIEEGIKEVMEWYKENRDQVDKRYNVFTFHEDYIFVKTL
jgi:dTDP-D-glucose 4,6-dehydratase